MTTTDAFDAFIDAIAERVAARIQARAPESVPLLSVSSKNLATASMS